MNTGYPVIIVVVVVVAGMKEQAAIIVDDVERCAMIWLAFMLLFEIMK